jgi:N-acetylneuraminate synthase
MQSDTTGLRLAGLPCGGAAAPLMVAELSGNHAGRLSNALAMIDAAADAGADLVKIQTYWPDTITIDHRGPDFVLQDGLWQGRHLYDLYAEAHTPWEWHAELFAHARSRGLPLFSSPFDPTAVDLLESLDCPIYKIASFELVDKGLLECVAATGKPVILSTGMATEDEVREAVDTLRAAGTAAVVLLHCTSAYPAPLDEANLRAMSALQDRFAAPVGLSDHTPGIAVPVAAVARGACLVEKHFTLNRDDGAVDAAFSLQPNEFAEMADACRVAQRALGSDLIGTTPSERGQLRFRRSLYVVEYIPAGAVVGPAQVRSIRPGGGLHPRELSRVIGSRARVAIAAGTPVSWDLFD